MRYVYFGHHKCASTWIDTIIKEVAIEKVNLCFEKSRLRGNMS